MIGKQFGSYQVVDLIGKGSMGEVYKAVDVSSQNRVAIKFAFLPSSRNDGKARLFARVSTYLLRMSHPNLVKGIELRKFAGRYSLVMELATEGNLGDLIAKRGKVGEVEGVKVITQVIDGLIYIHSCGFVHRDIKPQNVLLFENGVAKITDFDLLLPIGHRGKENSVLPLGSPCYMSPEQIKGKHLTVASDIYSLGITMYEVFTGKLPFFGSSVHDTMSKALNSPPLSPRKFNDELSPFVEKVILKCIEKEPEQRFPSLENLGQSLSFE